MKKVFHVYVGDIRLNINHSGVLSENGDACIVPHYETGISLTGVSAAFIHSIARSSIIEYQDYARDKKLEPGFSYVAASRGNYKYLIHTPALRRYDEKNREQVKLCMQLCISSCLFATKNIKAKNIVIPSMNTGKNGVLIYEDAAKATYQAIIDFVEDTSKKTLKEITIVLRSKDAIEAYLKALSDFI